MPVARPSAQHRWRCRQCGNLTRFDVVRVTRVREFVHQDLAGHPEVEESEVLHEVLEEVRCRWCGGTDTVGVVDRPGGPPDVATGAGSRGPTGDP